MRLTAVPKTYKGTLFRSTLEADWAATLDHLLIEWQYEPEALLLPSDLAYRPDFYLPRIATWLEVKGPHDERIGKTEELAAAVVHRPDCLEVCCGCYFDPYQLVVIGRASTYGMADWILLDPNVGWPDSGLNELCQCPRCLQWWWPTSGAYGCRTCRRGASGDDDLHGRSYWPGSKTGTECAGLGLPFVKAS